MHYFKYKAAENVLYEFADDIAPRHMTAALPLDYDTVAGADKFCNVFLTRLPADVSAQARHCPCAVDMWALVCCAVLTRVCCMLPGWPLAQFCACALPCFLSGRNMLSEAQVSASESSRSLPH